MPANRIASLESTPIGAVHVDLTWMASFVGTMRTVVLVLAAVGMLVSLANLLGRFWIDRSVSRAA